jgi:TolA-binding protein
MSENPDYPHGSDPGHSPEGQDFTPDFFDDVAEPVPPPVFVTHGEPPVYHEPSPPVYVASDTDYSPKPEPAPGVPVFPVVMGLLMIGSMGVGVMMNHAAAVTKANAPAAPAPVVSTAPVPVIDETVAGDVKSLKGEVEKLAGQLKDLLAKVESEPKPTPAVDLKPIQAKIDDLTKTVASVEGVGDKLDKIDAQVKSLDDGVKSATDKVSGLSEDVKKAAAAAAKAEADAAKALASSSTATTTTTTTAPAATYVKPEDDTTATALVQGTDLFKAGKYKEADDVFKKLAEASPKDARVYYYAALTNGLTTNDWKNDTVKIATQGAELEKSGATKAADVDAAFASLPDNLKPWLTYFRKLGK